MTEGTVDRPAHPAPEAGMPPRPLLRRMLGESAVYGLGGVANQALAIVLVPIYARQLGVANYGTVAILTTTLTLATLVATAALPQAFFRAYLQEARDEHERDAVLRTTFGLRIVISTLALIVFTALSLPIAIALIGSAAAWPLIALIGPIVFFDTLNQVPLSLLRAQRRPRPYAALSFSRAVLGSLLIVLFVVVLDMGVLGVVLGSLGSSVVAAIGGMLLLSRRWRPSLALDGRVARRMLAFSLPLVPASVAGWTLNLSDRYLLQALEGREAVGLYSAGYTVGLAINALAVAPFTLAWGAAYWEVSRQQNAREVIARVLTGFTALASFMALCLAAFGTDAIRILLTPAFEPARIVIPFSAFAYVLYGIFSIVSTGLNLESQTRRVPLILGGVAIGNVLLNLALIPALGYLGAAVSTLVSYGVLALVAGIVSQRYYPVPWEIGRVAASLALAMALAAAALIGPDHVAWRIACVAAYPLLAVALRIASLRRLAPILAFLRRR